MAPIMLSPPPALTSTSVAEAELSGGGGCSVPAGWSLEISGGSLSASSGSMASSTASAPLAFAHVQQGGAAGVAVFHDALRRSARSSGNRAAGAPWPARAKFFGSFFFSQRILEAVKPGSTALPRARMVALRPPSLLSDLLAFGGGGGVAPEFGGADDLAVLSRGTKPCCWPLTPMALTSAALALAWRKACRMRSAVASRQVCGMLFFGAGRQVGDQIIGLGAEPRTLPFRRPRRGLWWIACRCRCR